MSSANVNNVTNKVTSITTVANITNVTTVTNIAPSTSAEPSTSAYINEKDYQKMLDDIAKCTCCKIHAINRPTIYKPWIEIPYRTDAPDRPSNTIIDIMGEPDVICFCNCRINARMICRNHPDTPKYNI